MSHRNSSTHLSAGNLSIVSHGGAVDEHESTQRVVGTHGRQLRRTIVVDQPSPGRMAMARRCRADSRDLADADLSSGQIRMIKVVLTRRVRHRAGRPTEGGVCR